MRSHPPEEDAPRRPTSAGPECDGGAAEPVPASATLGNDVVDLAHPRTEGKEADRRFLERVLDPNERELVAEGGRRTLWTLWAAKEAAYKAAYKVACVSGDARPTFGHRAFQVALRDQGGGEPWGGTVLHGAVRYPFEVRATREWVHALALSPGGSFDRAVTGLEPVGEPPTDWRAALRREFTAREWDSVHSYPSALVRLRCRRALADALAIRQEQLEITTRPGPSGRTPPVLLIRGDPAGTDLSLSHHGRFVGWAFAAPLEAEGGPAPFSGSDGSSGAG